MSTQILDEIHPVEDRPGAPGGGTDSRSGVPFTDPATARTAAGRAARRRRQRVVSYTGPRSAQLPTSARGLRRGDCAAGLAPAPRRVGRWMRLATTITVVLVLAMAGVSVLQQSRAADSLGSTTELVLVQSGDTLWSIAAEAAPSVDPRVVIDRIKQLNGLTGDQLPVGLVLEVPVSG